MYSTILSIFILLFSCSKADQKWEKIQTSSSSEIQEQEAVGLLQRLLPDHYQLFKIKVLGQDFAPKNRDRVTLLSQDVLSNDIYEQHFGINEVINVFANTGVAAIWGINHYLKYFCNSHVSWDTTRIGKFEILQENKFPLCAL